LVTGAGDINLNFELTGIIVAGAGSGARVAVFNGDGTPRASFLAYAPGFGGGVRVAHIDLNGDGMDDIITGAGAGGGPDVNVINGTKLGQRNADGSIADSALLGRFFAFDPGFLGGVYVAVSDVNGDGKADVFVGSGASPSFAALVNVVDGTKVG